jgi:hypothetical protein
MAELLQERRGMGVSDPRDMIFAHVGFASDGQHESFTVDYSKTYVQVYEDFARYLANTHGLSALLACVGEGKSPIRLKDLPSWVPDWTNETPTTRFPGATENSEEGVSVASIWLREEPILACLLRVDTILFTSSELSVQQIPDNIRQTMSSRLANMDMEFDGREDIFMTAKTFDLLREGELWCDVYQIWRDMVQDDSILPPELPKLDLKLDMAFYGSPNHIVSYFVAFFLMLVFSTGVFPNMSMVESW